MTKPTFFTWPAPAGEAASPDYTLRVNGQPVFVCPARVREEIDKPSGSIWTHQLGGETEWASFAAFDFEGSVEVEITPTRAFQSAQILPTSFGVKPEIKDGVIRFTLERPRKLTLLLDNSDERPLHLFTSEPEKNAPKPNDPNVLYFGPGVHETGPLQLEDGQTVYIAGGAVVRGVILPEEKGVKNERTGLTSYSSGAVLNVEGVKNVRICGRGILEGSKMPHAARSLIALNDASNISIEGIVLRDSPNWNVVIAKSQDVSARDLKLISGRLNSDGVNSVGASNVTISDCFIRNHDDSIAVKTFAPDAPCAHILAENNVIWNDWGYALGVTYETRSDISDVIFRRCHILSARHWIMGVHVVDSGTISDIRFEEIEVEDMSRAAKRFGKMPELMRVALACDMWGTDDQRGHINGVVFKDIAVGGSTLPPSEFQGFDAQHRVDGVEIENLTHNSQRLETPEAAQLSINSFADVKFLNEK